MYISNKFPGDAKAAAQGSHFEDLGLKEVSGFVSQQPNIEVLGQQ